MQQSLRNALITSSVRKYVFSEIYKTERNQRQVFQWNIYCEMRFCYYYQFSV